MNVSLTEGLDKRFDLVYVDFKTQKCMPKLNAEWFRETAQRNAVVQARQEKGSA